MIEQTPIIRNSSFNKEAYRGLATAQMRILKDYMKVGGLNVYSRVVTLANGVVITCQKSFNREDIFISVPQALYTEVIKEEWLFGLLVTTQAYTVAPVDHDYNWEDSLIRKYAEYTADAEKIKVLNLFEGTPEKVLEPITAADIGEIEQYWTDGEIFVGTKTTSRYFYMDAYPWHYAKYFNVYDKSFDVPAQKIETDFTVLSAAQIKDNVTGVSVFAYTCFNFVTRGQEVYYKALRDGEPVWLKAANQSVITIKTSSPMFFAATEMKAYGHSLENYPEEYPEEYSAHFIYELTFTLVKDVNEETTLAYTVMKTYQPNVVTGNVVTALYCIDVCGNDLIKCHYVTETIPTTSTYAHYNMYFICDGITQPHKQFTGTHSYVTDYGYTADSRTLETIYYDCVGMDIRTTAKFYGYLEHRSFLNVPQAILERPDDPDFHYVETWLTETLTRKIAIDQQAVPAKAASETSQTIVYTTAVQASGAILIPLDEWDWLNIRESGLSHYKPVFIYMPKTFTVIPALTAVDTRVFLSWVFDSNGDALNYYSHVDELELDASGNKYFDTNLFYKAALAKPVKP